MSPCPACQNRSGVPDEDGWFTCPGCGRWRTVARFVAPMDQPIGTSISGASVVKFSQNDLTAMPLGEAVREALHFAYAMGCSDAMKHQPGATLDLILSAGEKAAGGNQ